MDIEIYDFNTFVQFDKVYFLFKNIAEKTI